jgi:hypothetical protein
MESMVYRLRKKPETRTKAFRFGLILHYLILIEELRVTR